MRKKMIFQMISGFVVGFIFMNVRLEKTYETKKIEDKIVLSDTSARPYYYIITKDSLGNIDQEQISVEDYAYFKVGSKYKFTNLTLIFKK